MTTFKCQVNFMFFQTFERRSLCMQILGNRKTSFVTTPFVNATDNILRSIYCKALNNSCRTAAQDVR